MSARNPSNRLALDYRREAQNFAQLPYPIIDVHSHISGTRAVTLYSEAAQAYGVELTYSMTALEELSTVRAQLGERVRFIAMALFGGPNPRHNMGKGYIERLKGFRAEGATIAKFWSAPRILEFGSEPFLTSPFRLTAPERLEAMRAAVDMGFVLMVHVGDPDTWFATRYRDATRYGTKQAHYEDLEHFLGLAGVRTIAAHMGGWPEDLNFLSGLLERNSNLYLDTSATKWMVRELSKHPRASFLTFLERWRGRILFGSDIVTTDLHLSDTAEKPHEMARKASDEEQAFDLYASRYWALRKLLETSYRGESPISDPDLAMVDPQHFTPDSAPELVGHSLPGDLLKVMYHAAAVAFFGS